MSLHAQITPEAEAALAAQKRNSTITAIIIALLCLVLIGVILMTIALVTSTKDTPPLVSYQGNPEADDKLEKPEVTNAVSKKPSSPSASATRVIVATTNSAVAVPNPDIPIENPSPEFGDGDSFGDGWGDGDGDGAGAGGWGSIPSSIAKRCSKQDRMQRLTKTGGTPACEDAVVNALRWFKKTQNADGSWCADANPVGMTGLALLAYLGHCETPHSPEFGESVEKAIAYLVANASKATNNGKLSSDFSDNHWSYEHAVATYALAEAYTFCNIIDYEIPGLMETVQQAGDILIAGQNNLGSWDYAFIKRNRIDNSLGAFCMQALKACKATGLKFRNINEVGRKGLEAIARCQDTDGWIGYGNSKRRPRNSLTAAGLLCHYQWKKPNDVAARKAKKWMEANTDYNLDNNNGKYAHYYRGQVFMEIGGKSWQAYNEAFRDKLLADQEQDGSFGSGGGFLMPRKNSHRKHYLTALSTLQLEVYYRFLPSDSK